MDKNEDLITKEYLEDWDDNEDEKFFWTYKKRCKKKTIGEYIRGHIKNRPGLYMGKNIKNMNINTTKNIYCLEGI